MIICQSAMISKTTGSTLKDGLYFNMDFVKISSEYALTKQEIFRDTGDTTFDEKIIYHYVTCQKFCKY